MPENETQISEKAGSFRLPIALYERLESLAQTERRSVSFMVREAIELMLDQRESEAE